VEKDKRGREERRRREKEKKKNFYNQKSLAY
jgi:hypothetical protein